MIDETNRSDRDAIAVAQIRLAVERGVTDRRPILAAQIFYPHLVTIDDDGEGRSHTLYLYKR